MSEELKVRGYKNDTKTNQEIALGEIIVLSLIWTDFPLQRKSSEGCKLKGRREEDTLFDTGTPP